MDTTKLETAQNGVQKNLKQREAEVEELKAELKDAKKGLAQNDAQLADVEKDLREVNTKLKSAENQVKLKKLTAERCRNEESRKLIQERWDYYAERVRTFLNLLYFTPGKTTFDFVSLKSTF